MSSRLPVHVTPRAGRDEVGEWRDGELQVRVTAAPDDGKANRAVCELLAKKAGVPKSSVSVERGASSRHKIVAFSSSAPDDLVSAFGVPPKRD